MVNVSLKRLLMNPDEVNIKKIIREEEERVEKEKTLEEKINEIPELLKNVPYHFYIEKYFINNPSEYKYRLLKDFVKYNKSTVSGIDVGKTLIKGNHVLVWGEQIIDYNTTWSYFLGIKNGKPLCLRLKKGVGFNKDYLQISEPIIGDEYEVINIADIPSVHGVETRGYKTAYKNACKYAKLHFEEKELKMFECNTFSLEELQNIRNWCFDSTRESRDSWYGDSCITDQYYLMKLDTGYFKYQEKIVINTYGYRY